MTKYFILYTIGNDKILHIAYSVFLYLSNGIISSKCVTHCLHHVFTLVEELHVGRVGVTCRSNEMRTFLKIYFYGESKQKFLLNTFLHSPYGNESFLKSLPCIKNFTRPISFQYL